MINIHKMKNSFILAGLFFLLMHAASAQNNNARTINVNSVAELQSAANVAQRGDVIILADNTYTNTGLIKIGADGITVKAATPGGVVFTGNSLCKISGNNIVFSGFQFKNGDIGTGKVVAVSGNYNSITQCNFYNYVSKNYVHFEGGSHDNELSYSNLEAKPATMNAGPGIQVTTSPTVINHTKIRYCTFLNFGGDGGDFGNEPIRIGLGAEQNNISGALVEFCYFENLGSGDSETVSVKSTSNVIRYNTCNNNPTGQFVFRTGNKNTAYGNFFFNSGGIRIKEGGNHMVYNNYFEGSGTVPTIQLMNFVLNAKTKVGSTLNNILLYHNTFYNAGIVELGGAGENPPKNVVFANNIFYKNSGTMLSDLNSNVIFTSNLFYGGAALGTSCSKKEFTEADPLLIKNKNGFFGLSAKSPAINKSIATYPAILKNPEVDNDPELLLDIEGQPRPADKSQKDIGCDEFTTGNSLNKPLSRLLTGPSYLSAVPVSNKEVAVVASKPSRIKDTASFENEYFRFKQNFIAEQKTELGTRVIVALSNVKIKSSQGNSKIERGQVYVIKSNETCKVTGGEYFEVIVKKNHPALHTPEKWMEPIKNKVLYEDEQFRVFEERLDAGDTRPLHSHAQRVVVRLNEVQLTDPTTKENTLPGAGVQIPDTAKYADAISHVVKNLSTIPLFNIVIEFKTVHN